MTEIGISLFAVALRAKERILKMKHNRIIATVLLVIIAFWAYLTTQLPETTMIGEPGPKFFPAVILGIMAILSVSLYFTKDLQKAEEIEADEIEKEIEPQEELPMSGALKLFAIFFVGIILVYLVGFTIGLIVSLSAMLWMIGWKLFPRAILFSTSVTLAIYFLFSWALKIPLPNGSLF